MSNPLGHSYCRKHNYCRKHRFDASFWCRLPVDHEGLCENGISFSRIPYIGTKEDAMVDITNLMKSIDKTSKKDYGRKMTAWREAMGWVKFYQEAIQKRLDYIANLRYCYWSPEHKQTIVDAGNKAKEMYTIDGELFEVTGTYTEECDSYLAAYDDARFLGIGLFYERREPQKFVTPPIITQG